jgi:large subunit ribosomal protein L29
MKQEEIKDLSLQELKDKVNEMTTQQARLVFNHTVSASENPIGIRHTRRAIARIKTEIRKRANQESAQ